MARKTDAPPVNITINGIDLQVPKGELIVESVKRLGLEIPIFCYHPRMKPVGMCRMCLVEVGMKQPDGSVRKMPKPQAACTLPASEGLVIFTDTEQIHKDRKGVLEFLLINHPLDCPICDRGGECPLQNNTLFYGPSTSRFVEMKRHAVKAYPLSKHVTLDLERCIQCGRCVRFTEEISGDAQLAFRHRGAEMQPVTFELEEFTSKFSGNTIEICPVGALTSSHYRFRARPWDLETAPGICTMCSNGCNVWFDRRKGKLVRINGRTNEAVNEEWTCDKGKFGTDWMNNPRRASDVKVRRGDGFSRADWAEAYAEILERFREGGHEVAGLAGPMLSNEDLYLLRRMFDETFGSSNLDHRMTSVQGPAVEPPSFTIEGLEDEKGAFVFGASLSDESPIVYLRLRKAWYRQGARICVATSRPDDADAFAAVSVRYPQGGEAEFLRSLVAELRVQLEGGRSFGELADLASTLLETRGPILATESLWNLDQAGEVLAQLRLAAELLGVSLNVMALGANGQGAEELGVRPDAFDRTGLGTRQILEACADGRIRALWLAGVDPFEAFPDRSLVQRALENVEYLVVQTALETEAAAYASVVLPITAPGESDGSFTNVERRVQAFEKAVDPPAEAKPAWRVFSELMVRAEPRTPHFSAREILAEIAREVPAFQGVEWSAARDGGVLLGARRPLSRARS
ncbi:MAG: NADH-quinone oxidoreductase subunit NuoG [Fimbriimonadales bacterium]|nr:NADH-quinone oxidoreductase subunit NuoG [Fimbriimonadales bacterium]